MKTSVWHPYLNNSFCAADAWWCVVPVDLSETFNLKALNFILFWKNGDNSASWTVSLPWLLCESHIPHFRIHPSGIISIYFWTQSFSNSTRKCSWMQFFLLFLYSLHCIVTPPTLIFPSMFYQAVLEECTALLNILVAPESTNPKSPLYDFLGKPIRRRTPAVLIWAATSHWVRDLCFYACALNLFIHGLCAVTYLGKGFVIKEFAGPSCQLSTLGFNYRTDGGENMSQRIPWHLPHEWKLHNLY